MGLLFLWWPLALTWGSTPPPPRKKFSDTPKYLEALENVKKKSFLFSKIFPVTLQKFCFKKRKKQKSAKSQRTS